MLLDVDECNNNGHNCHVGKANCLNIPGSFECHCKDGYTGNGTFCSGLYCSQYSLTFIYYELENNYM